MSSWHSVAPPCTVECRRHTDAVSDHDDIADRRDIHRSNPVTWMSNLSFQAVVVLTSHLSGFVNSPTLLVSSCRTEVVSCILDQESSILAISSVKYKSHEYASSAHVMFPALFSVVLFNT